MPAFLEHLLHVSMSVHLTGAVVIDLILLFREIKTTWVS